MGQIDNSLTDMKASLETIVGHIDNMSTLTQSQAATTQEVNASAEEIGAMTEAVMGLVKKI